MLRLKATLIAILFVFSLGVSGVKAHRGTNGRVDAQVSVDLLNTSGMQRKLELPLLFEELQVRTMDKAISIRIRATSICTFTSTGHT